MLERLKEKVFIANQDLIEMAPYPFSWVSVSAIDREKGLVVMTPDGGAVTEADMTVVDLQGNVLEGRELPVRDKAVHLALYETFPEISSVARPYSRWATVFAQLELRIPVLGTIHADTFRGDIPAANIAGVLPLADTDSGRIADAIAEAYRGADCSPVQVPAVLVNGQGSYTFGNDARTAVLNAAVLEEAAFLAYHTLQMDPGIRPMGLTCQKNNG